MNFKNGVPLAFLLGAVSLAGAQDQRVATLKSVTGEVVLSKGNLVRTAAVGAGMADADQLVTGREASASLTLKDGTLVTVGPNTTLALTQVQFDSTTQDGSLAVTLFKGSLRMVTGWLGKLHPEQVKVITPTSVVGVRGTDFIVEVP